MSTISKLPNEVLLEILRECVREWNPRSTSITNSKHPWHSKGDRDDDPEIWCARPVGYPDHASGLWWPITLIHVSYRWRAVAFSCPSLWSFIDSDLCLRPKLLKEYISWSRKALLDVVIQPPPLMWRRSRLGMRCEMLGCGLQIVVRQSSRIRTHTFACSQSILIRCLFRPCLYSHSRHLSGSVLPPTFASTLKLFKPSSEIPNSYVLSLCTTSPWTGALSVPFP